jgi:cytochrome b involved in lipid metabolism
MSSPLPSISVTELALHSTKDSAWIAVQDYSSSWVFVYDVTQYLQSHPGGADLIVPHLGTDATDTFFNRFEVGVAKLKLTTSAKECQES